MVNLKDFDSRLLKLDKNSSIDINIYYIGYVTKKPEYNINSVNPLYLLIAELDDYIEDSKNEVLKKVWSGIKDQIKNVNDCRSRKYGKDYMKIKFNCDDHLPLNKILKFCVLSIIIRNVFEKDNKYYPQFF